MCIYDEKYLGRTEGQTDRGKTVYPPPSSGSGGIITCILESNALHYTLHFINFIIKRNIYTKFYTEILVTIK